MRKSKDAVNQRVRFVQAVLIQKLGAERYSLSFVSRRYCDLTWQPIRVVSRIAPSVALTRRVSERFCMSTNNEIPLASIPASIPVGGGGFSVFDAADAQSINKARLGHLASLNLDFRGKRVLDVGCGVGHLGGFFEERGGSVVGVDARPENVGRLRALYPERQAHVANVESRMLTELGRFDIVFCYGLLYHLENPIAALRNIAACCKDILLLETVITDDARPVLLLVDEPSETKNQAVSGFGCRPSPAFVTMALNRIGFTSVYTTKSRPDHVDFVFDWRNSGEWQRDGHLLRCIFVASRSRLDHSGLVLLLQSPDA